MRARHLCLVSGLALVVAACGGGDDVRINVRAAHASYANLEGTWEMTGLASNGTRHTFTSTYRPMAAGVFPYSGEIAVRREQNNTWQHGADIAYFDPDTMLAMGLQYGEECLVVEPSTLPDSAEIGDSGSLFDSVRFAPECGTQFDVWELDKYFWSLQMIDDIPHFCMGPTTDNPDLFASLRECYEVDESGTLGSRSAVIQITDVRTPSTSRFELVAKGHRIGP